MEPNTNEPMNERNVTWKTWMVDGKPVQVRCFLCGHVFTLSQSKKGKPYGVCPVCGYQIFFRMSEGISRLIQTAQNPQASAGEEQQKRETELEAKLREAEEKRQALEARLKENAAAITQLQNALAAKEKEVDDLRRLGEEKNTALAKALEEKATLEKELQKLYMKEASLISEKRRLEKMKAAVEEKLAQLRDSLKYWRETANYFRATRDEFGWKLVETEEKLKQSQEFLKQYKKRVTTLGVVLGALVFLLLISVGKMLYEKA
jgi:DNA repair exonuclease SbcCD ATPase subunit